MAPRRIFAFAFAFAVVMALPAQAQTLRDALAKAYSTNPQLQAARAALRVVDENVPQAAAGYRPTIAVNAEYGWQTSVAQTPGGDVGRVSKPGGVGLSVQQNVFDGFRTPSSISRAEAGVLAQREVLRATEQDVLFQASTAYMDVVRDEALFALRENFVTVLAEQRDAAQARFNAGDLTQTDVAQSAARLSLAESQREAARAQRNVSRANFRRLIGAQPGKLTGRISLKPLLPKSLPAAQAQGLNENPQVRAAAYGIDAADFAIKIAESSFYPNVSIAGTAQRRLEPQANVDRLDSASVVGQVVVPLYQAGLPDSQVRQSKELAAQRRIELDSVRDQVRALITGNWGNRDATEAQLLAAQAQIKANQLALNGVREEAKVGQRTMLDVLNAEQEYLDAQVNHVIAERNRVVAALALLGSVGRLNAASLQLPVALHDPAQHLEQVRDRWGGMRVEGE